MRILLTGATGYIGKRLLPVLVDQGHYVICCVRDLDRFNPPKSISAYVEAIEVDLLHESSLNKIPNDIDGAYYLVHSMSTSVEYDQLEQRSAINFRNALNKTAVIHVIYLSGIINEQNLSRHLSSRKKVEGELTKGTYNFTTLRAGIIIGSGSASFEIMRDLVEKLPVMITPKWLNTKCQPVGISDVMAFLSKTLFNPSTYNRNFDIGGTDILTYKEMLLTFGKVRKLKRKIITVPIMTPRLSSYWLYFVTSTSYKLATALVNSMKVNVICRDDSINHILDIEPISYKEALQKAFMRIQNNEIVSSWKDSLISGRLDINISDFLHIPVYGCYIDQRIEKYRNRDMCIDKIWRLGGDNGWYLYNWLWRLRGFIDKLAGGVGLRRGRTSPDMITAGDVIDVWRVLYADKEEGKLMLFAEMKLPGEAWLDFKIEGDVLIQTATFRPKGVLGRLYWFAMIPFHKLLFKGLIKKLVSVKQK